jgi:16S rRNA (cytosine967-C5)-methyltransferase
MKELSPVRNIARRLLEEGETPGANLRDEVHRAAAAEGLSRRDAALLLRITMGAVRWRRTLGRILSVYSGRSLAQIEPSLQPILAAALYEIVFLEKVPPRAAIYEAVELAKSRTGRRAGGFVNAVLRNVTRGMSGPGPVGEGHLSAVRIGPGRFRTFDRALFPDPTEDLAGFLADALSHPPWLVARWLRVYGPDRTRGILEGNNDIRDATLRGNPLRPPPGGLVAYLRAQGIPSRPGSIPGSARVEDIRGALSLDGFQKGMFTVQDETAQSAARLAAVRPGETVLDACAAPGGKTGAVFPDAGAEGMVVALDLRAERLGTTRDTLGRLGYSVPLLRADARKPPFRRCGFDTVLLDVPCSNTGVLGPRVEVRWRLNPERIDELRRLQGKLLDACAPLARGKIVYSTCSIEPEENQIAVRSFLARSRGWRIEEESLALPGPSDGGYAARLVPRT